MKRVPISFKGVLWALRNKQNRLIGDTAPYLYESRKLAEENIVCPEEKIVKIYVVIKEIPRDIGGKR